MEEVNALLSALVVVVVLRGEVVSPEEGVLPGEVVLSEEVKLSEAVVSSVEVASLLGAVTTSCFSALGSDQE